MGRTMTKAGKGCHALWYVFYFLDVAGRVCPSSLRFCHFDATRRGIPLLLVLFPFQHGEEGHAPSPSCLCFIFDALGRGMSLLVAFSLFRHDEEGYTLLVVLFLFQHGEEGHAPPRRVFVSSLTRWGGAYPQHHVFPISTRRGRACPLLVVFLLYFRRVGEGYALPRCVIAF